MMLGRVNARRRIGVRSTIGQVSRPRVRLRMRDA